MEIADFSALPKRTAKIGVFQFKRNTQSSIFKGFYSPRLRYTSAGKALPGNHPANKKSPSLPATAAFPLTLSYSGAKTNGL